MANFKTHVNIAALASTGAAALAVNVQLITLTHMPWFIFLGVVGGMLPDIDANRSKPVRLLFMILALMSASAVLQIVKTMMVSYQALALAAASYFFVRYGVLKLFNKLTVHRGVFHSILAALFFGLLMTCISYHLLHWQLIPAWLNGLFITFGFIVHLLLDETYSVDLSNARLKKSFGTALKLFSYNNFFASLLLAVCTLALCHLAPPLTPFVKLVKTAQWHY